MLSINLIFWLKPGVKFLDPPVTSLNPESLNNDDAGSVVARLGAIESENPSSKCSPKSLLDLSAGLPSTFLSMLSALSTVMTSLSSSSSSKSSWRTRVRVWLRSIGTGSTKSVITSLFSRGATNVCKKFKIQITTTSNTSCICPCCIFQLDPWSKYASLTFLLLLHYFLFYCKKKMLKCVYTYDTALESSIFPPFYTFLNNFALFLYQNNVKNIFLQQKDIHLLVKIYNRTHHKAIKKQC